MLYIGSDENGRVGEEGYVVKLVEVMSEAAVRGMLSEGRLQHRPARHP
jgi:hypothetical protein